MKDTIDRIHALVNGNPWAMAVMGFIPVTELTGVTKQLERYEIKGSQIWVLFKDVCGEDSRYFRALLWAVDQGHIKIEHLQAAANEEPMEIELKEVYLEWEEMQKNE